MDPGLRREDGLPCGAQIRAGNHPLLKAVHGRQGWQPL